ncbi:MAG: hypothetical protein ABIU10_07005 [Sphingomicrobium sp.]
MQMWKKIKVWSGRVVMALMVALFVYAFAQTLPIDFALLVAVDMAVYVDALVGVYVIAQVTKLRPMIAYLRLRASAFRGRLNKRARRIRTHVIDGHKSPANDDDPAWAMAA